MKLLALGDSYTIGEGVLYSENYPSLLASRLEGVDEKISDLTIIAQTGWTTGELLNAIKVRDLKEKFDFVFLLIGVNNQYRGYAIEEYKDEFNKLLQIAIDYSLKGADNVFVLSIPDWGNTPFADGKDKGKISSEIDKFNEMNFLLSQKKNVNYIDVTELTRMSPLPPTLLTSDKLHPSSEMYALWADKIYKHLNR